ncbi:MAG: hypothetical protein LBT59_17305 [Clostridiales bacterium]|nr:hypothetical protein [Clostridiales bacterium]
MVRKLIVTLAIAIVVLAGILGYVFRDAYEATRFTISMKLDGAFCKATIKADREAEGVFMTLKNKDAGVSIKKAFLKLDQIFYPGSFDGNERASGNGYYSGFDENFEAYTVDGGVLIVYRYFVNFVPVVRLYLYKEEEKSVRQLEHIYKKPYPDQYDPEMVFSITPTQNAYPAWDDTVKFSGTIQLEKSRMARVDYPFIHFSELIEMTDEVIFNMGLLASDASTPQVWYGMAFFSAADAYVDESKHVVLVYNRPNDALHDFKEFSTKIYIRLRLDGNVLIPVESGFLGK